MRENQPNKHESRITRIRSFVAVNLPVEIINKVMEVQAELRTRAQRAGMRVGWVPATGMHVTLKFLAEIPEETVWAVRDTLTERLAGRSALRLQLCGAGAFPSRSHPRVLWIGIKSNGEALTRLGTDVDQWLEQLGFSKETRPFHPHLTLGRVKESPADVLEGLEAIDLGACTVREVVLYRSILRRQGAEYQPLARIPLTETAQGAD